MTDITELAQSLKAAAENAIVAHERLAAYPYGEIIDISQHEGEQIDIDITDINEFHEEASPANVLALVDALEKAQQQIVELQQGCENDPRIHEIIDLKERIAELESQIKFPGVMRCNTCGFSRSHVIVTPGGMLAGESEPEHCPNGCGPLWHETYRRQYNELYDAYKELESRTVKLPLKIERDDADDWFMYKGGRVGGGAAEWYNKALDDVGAELTAAGIKWEAE